MPGSGNKTKYLYRGVTVLHFRYKHLGSLSLSLSPSFTPLLSKTGSLCSPGYPVTLCVDQVGLEIIEMCQPPKCATMPGLVLISLVYFQHLLCLRLFISQTVWGMVFLIVSCESHFFHTWWVSKRGSIYIYSTTHSDGGGPWNIIPSLKKLPQGLEMAQTWRK